MQTVYVQAAKQAPALGKRHQVFKEKEKGEGCVTRPQRQVNGGGGLLTGNAMDDVRFVKPYTGGYTFDQWPRSDR